MIDLTTLNVDQLKQLVAEATAEISRREQPDMAARVDLRIPTRPYNNRRYGRPWAAVVTRWPAGGKPEMEFASSLGGRDGDAGELRMTVAAGEVIRWGQKDLRRHDKTTSRWGVVASDGKVHQVDEMVARRHFDGEPAELGEAVPVEDLQF